MKKAYAKIKAQEPQSSRPKPIYATEENTVGEKNEGGDDSQDEPASLELHPQRQALLAEPSPERAPKPDGAPKNTDAPKRQEKKPRPSAFAKELEIAEKRKQDAEARRQEREFRRKDREAMSRARRPDQHGKRRLGRESKVLLGRVQRMVGPA